jgi:hypothetical protein
MTQIDAKCSQSRHRTVCREAVTPEGRDTACYDLGGAGLTGNHRRTARPRVSRDERTTMIFEAVATGGCRPFLLYRGRIEKTFGPFGKPPPARGDSLSTALPGCVDLTT